MFTGRTSSFRSASGRAPKCEMTSAAAMRAGFEAALERPAAAARGEEAGGEQVAGAGRVDDLVDRRRGNLDAPAVLDRDRARARRA